MNRIENTNTELADIYIITLIVVQVSEVPRQQCSLNLGLQYIQ